MLSNAEDLQRMQRKVSVKESAIRCCNQHPASVALIKGQERSLQPKVESRMWKVEESDIGCF